MSSEFPMEDLRTKLDALCLRHQLPLLVAVFLTPQNQMCAYSVANSAPVHAGAGVLLPAICKTVAACREAANAAADKALSKIAEAN